MSDLLTNPLSFPHGDIALMRVKGNSMLPILRDGEIVVVKSFSEYCVGDVVVIQRKNADHIIHRIIEVKGLNNEMLYLTKGDNINIIDRWFRKKDIIGKVIDLINNEEEKVKHTKLLR